MLCLLIRQLVDASVTVNGAFRAPLGLPQILFSETAVQESRFILLLLTQAYVDSNYAEFEGLLAQHVGIEESAHRIIPIMLEPCEPRLGLRIVQPLDMSTNEKFNLNIHRLLQQIKSDYQPKDRANTQTKGGIRDEKLVICESTSFRKTQK